MFKINNIKLKFYENCLVPNFIPPKVNALQKEFTSTDLFLTRIKHAGKIFEATY